MTDAPEVEDSVDHMRENVPEPVLNNSVADGTEENPPKETLVSDITHETFSPGFEFSVTVEPKTAGEDGSFEREITIPGSDPTSDENRTDPEITIERHMNALAEPTIQEEDESSFIVVPPAVLESADQVAPTAVELESAKPESAAIEADRPGTPFETEANATLEGVETPSHDETAAELTPAQHGPSAAQHIRATPEPVLILSTEEQPPAHLSTPTTPEVTRKSMVSVHAEHPQSGTSTLTGSEDVTSNGPIPKLGSTSSSTAGESTRGKKKSLFHFKLGPLKKAKSEAQPSGGGEEAVEKTTTVQVVAKEPSGQHKFTTNVKKAFGTLRRTMSLHHKSGERPEPRIRASSRPVRPPPPWRENRSKEPVLKKHSSLQALNQPSASASVSRPSLPGTPQLSKRQRLQAALPYFNKAMPTEITANEGQKSENIILSHVAANIALPRRQIVNQNSQSSVPEERIQPILVQRSASISDETAAGGVVFNLHQSSGSLRAVPARPGGGLPPKPPRPQSPPLLSPLDYQHYNDSVGQSDLTAQRLAMMNELHTSPEGEPDSIQVMHTSGMVQAQKPQYQYKTEGKTTSVDFSHQDEYSQGSPPTIRRTQTLRTDYASLVRDRVRSLRPDPKSTEVTSVRPLKARPKAENYVCSETIKMPKFNLKLKRRQTVPPKTVHARSGKDKDISQPEQSRFASYYHPGYGRPDSPISDFHSEYVTTSQMGVLQSTPPMVIRKQQQQVNLQNGNQDMKYTQPIRQITSLHSVGITSVMHQQQTHLTDSPEKGLFLHYPPTVQTREELKSLSLPYFAEPLASESETTTPSSDDVLLASSIRNSESFLSNWDQMSSKTQEEGAKEDEGEKEKQLEQDNTRHQLADYLRVCVRLRSVDLQGQFAPFHYPLPWFDLKVWPKHGQFAEWTRVLVVQQPNTTETASYIYLDPSHAKQEKLIYPERSLDTLLTNWLDSHHTSPPVTNLQADTTPAPTARQTHSSILHPVQIASTLNQLLQSKPYQNASRNELLHTCFRLAAALSYTDCLESLPQPADGATPKLDVNNVLAVISSANCLMLFHYDLVTEPAAAAAAAAETNEPVPESSPETKETDEPTTTTTTNKPEEDILARLVGADQATVRQSIDDLITQLYQHTMACVHETGGLPNLMKSIAPPDWLAMMLARVWIAKCP